LAPLAYQNKRILYRLLFQASAATLLEVAADPRHLGAQIGFLSVLHTWGQNLQHHPHVYCVIPAGGLSADHTRWIQPRYPFFLPIKVLSRVFRGKFVAGLRREFQPGKLGFYGDQEALRDPKLFRTLLRSLFRQDWIVYAKPPFGGPEYVLHYLARYTHRVAISNHRLVAFQNGQVTFPWKDYAHGNKKRKMTLTADEFLRRFLWHVLPKGFVRIRFFGFLANRRRATLLPICRQVLAARPPSSSARPAPAQPPTSWSCPTLWGTHDHHREAHRKADLASPRWTCGVSLTRPEPNPLPESRCASARKPAPRKTHSQAAVRLSRCLPKTSPLAFSSPHTPRHGRIQNSPNPPKTTTPHSNPIGGRVRRKRQRLRSNDSIESDPANQRSSSHPNVLPPGHSR